MNIVITRNDLALGYRTPISAEQCADWVAVSAALAIRGIDFAPAVLRDFHAEQPDAPITFDRIEFLNFGLAAYSARVGYVIETTP